MYGESPLALPTFSQKGVSHGELPLARSPEFNLTYD